MNYLINHEAPNLWASSSSNHQGRVIGVKKSNPTFPVSKQMTIPVHVLIYANQRA